MRAAVWREKDRLHSGFNVEPHVEMYEGVHKLLDINTGEKFPLG